MQKQQKRGSGDPVYFPFHSSLPHSFSTSLFPPVRGKVKSLEGGVNRNDPNLFMAIIRTIWYGLGGGGLINRIYYNKITFFLFSWKILLQLYYFSLFAIIVVFLGGDEETSFDLRYLFRKHK